LQVPPGILKPDAYYRFRVEARDSVIPLNLDNVSKTPASNNDNYIFYTDSVQAEAPYIELDNHGVHTWSGDQEGLKLSFWIKVHDAQGVPGDIQSVKVKHPGGTEEDLTLYESNQYSPTSATSGIYILDSALPPVDGTFEFTVLDQAGNSHTVSEDLTANAVAPPQSLQITNIDGTAVSFDWGTVTGAVLYTLYIFDNDLDLIYSFHTPVSEYQLAEGFLKSNQTYRWRVQARRELFGNNVDNVSGTPANYEDAISFSIGLVDSDGDGMPDPWEIANGLNPAVDDADLNPDGDSLTNLEEFQRGSNPNVYDATVDDGLLLYYPMDGSALDASGNENDGTVNGAVPTEDQFGISNQAYSFDGGSNIEVGLTAIADYPFTFAAWIKTAGASAVIANLADNTVEKTYYDLGINLDGTVYLRSRFDDGNESAAISTQSVNDNRWHYAVGVFASDSQRILYLDGELAAQDADTVAYNPAVNVFDIGRRGDASPQSYFNGVIDEVRLYDRALSQSEVKSLYSRFYEIQAIATSGASDWESFMINGEPYLAVANFHNGITGDIDSKIYKATNAVFNEIQSIPTHGALNWESVRIDGDIYLAVANRFSGPGFDNDSKIYKWNGSSFVEFQSIPTIGAYDWESFAINGETYLAVTNYSNGTTHNIDSKIYQWNGTSFVEYQSIPTNGAYDWEAFEINGETYLAVANNYDDSFYNIDSKIYKWNGSTFDEYQSIPTNGANDWESFRIDGETYLAVANANDGFNTKVESKIYQWNGSGFVEVQAILTQGARDWESFAIGSELFLAIANHNDESNYSVDSKIYKWSGSAFVETQAIPTSGASDWESFDIEGNAYLALANFTDAGDLNIESNIYASSIISDSDGDGLPDSWEMDHFGDLTHDGTGHSDADNLTDLEEFQNATDPNNPDTDGDWVNDSDEVGTGTNPNDPGDFTPPGTSAIRGTVRDADGTPITGTQLNVNIYSNAMCGANWQNGVAVDESNGRYIFVGLAPGLYYTNTYNLNLSNYVNEWWASFSSVIDCRDAQAVSTTADGLADNIDFQLDLGGSISGTVKNAATNDPIQNVHINVYNDSKDGGASADTDAAGNFTIRGIPAGCVEIWVKPPSTSDYVIPIGQSIYLDPDENLTGVDYDLDTGGLKISGTVTANGTELEGVSIGFENEDLGIHQHAQTNASGFYELTNLPPVPGLLSVQARGTDRAYVGQYIETLAADLTGLDFNLPLQACVTGRVVDENGDQLAGAEVEIELESRNIELEFDTDADGTYTICNLPEGIAEIYAASGQPPGYCETDGRFIYISGGVNNPVDDIVLEPCTTVAGTVAYNGPADSCAFDWSEIVAEGRNFDSDGDIADDYSYQISLPDGGHHLYLDTDEDSTPYSLAAYPQAVTITDGSVDSGPGVMEIIHQGHTDAATISGFIIDSADPDPTGKFVLGLILPGSFDNITPEKLAGVSSIQEIEYNGFVGPTELPYNPVPVPPGSYDVFWLLDNEDRHNIDSFTILGLVSGIQVLTGGKVQDSDNNPITSIEFNYNSAGSENVYGYVKDNNDQPVLGAEVLITDNGTLAAYAVTDETGRWEVHNLPANNFTIAASHWFFESDAVLSKLENISISVGLETEIDNLTLNTPASIPGSIEGTVTRDLDDESIPGLWVTAHNYINGQWMGNAQTQADGSYKIIDLPAGIYRVEVSTGGTDYIREYYDNTYDHNSAIPVTVTAGSDITSVNFGLAIGGSISGQLTDVNGLAIQNVCVNAYTGRCHQGHLSSTQSDIDGNYVIRGLPTGTDVYLRFDGNCSGGNYIQEWYDGQYDCNNAQSVAGITSGVNATLDAGASISGIVKDANGDTITDVQISVHAHGTTPNSSSRGTYASQTDGTYTISGLAPGTYKIQANNNWAPGYVSKYYNNKTSDDTANEVVLASGQGIAGIDFNLEEDSPISGTIYQSDGITPITGTEIRVEVLQGDPCHDHEWVTSTHTNSSNGTYTISGLHPGNYVLRTDNLNQSNYVNDWYSENGSSYYCDDAGVVTVGAGGKSDIDFQLDLGATISGTVTDAGAPIDGTVDGFHVHPVIGNPCEWNEIGSANIEADGTYTIYGVPEGEIYVRTCDGGGSSPYILEWWADPNSVYNCNEAQPIHVATGENVTNKNFQLEKGGIISGRVLDQNTGSPVEDQSVGNIELNVGWHKFVYRQTEGDSGQASRAAFKAPGDGDWRIFSTEELNIRTEPDGAQTGILLVNKRNTCTYQWPNTHARLVQCVDTEASSEGGWYGESIVNRVYHDENIHGNSDFYTSYYEAYFYADTAGTWHFSTDSDDASEIEINGDVVAAWYGGHGTVDRWENKYRACA